MPFNKFNIPHPCSEDWNKMKIALNARHCDHCNKEVVDFTRMSREEILTYLIQNAEKKVCGRISKSQLDFTTEDWVVSVTKSIEPKGVGTLSFASLLLLGITIFPSCGNSSNQIQAEPQTTDASAYQIDRTITDSLSKQSTTRDSELPTAPADFPPILGEVVEISDRIYPEFPGGMDSLQSFFKKNLRYPQFEVDNKIEGRIYVEFTVDTLGNVLNPRIVKSILGQKNLDVEVMRMMNLMPKWKPGEIINQNGEHSKAKMTFTLPIQFKLEQK